MPPKPKKTTSGLHPLTLSTDMPTKDFDKSDHSDKFDPSTSNMHSYFKELKCVGPSGKELKWQKPTAYVEADEYYPPQDAAQSAVSCKQ